MTLPRILLAALLATAPLGLAAQGFEGARLGAAVTAVDGGDDVTTSLGLGVQYGLTPALAVALNGTIHLNEDFSDEHMLSLTAHALYRVTPATTLGVYHAVDGRSDYWSIKGWGIEAETQLSRATIQAWIGTMQGDSPRYTVAGLDARLPFGGDRFAVTGSLYHAYLDADRYFTRYSVGGEYALNSALSLHASASHVEVQGGGSQSDMLSVGFRYNLALGTTFGGRGHYDTLFAGF